MDEAARSVRRCDAAESWCGRVDRIVDKSGTADRLVFPRTNRRIGGSTRREIKRPPRRSSKWLNSNRIAERQASISSRASRLDGNFGRGSPRKKRWRFRVLISFQADSNGGFIIYRLYVNSLGCFSAQPIFRARLLDPVERAFHAPAALVEHVRVDHRRGNVLMPKELLDRAYVVAGLEQMGREAVSQYVRRN